MYELDTSEFAGSPATDREILDRGEVGVAELFEAAQDDTESVEDVSR